MRGWWSKTQFDLRRLSFTLANSRLISETAHFFSGKFSGVQYPLKRAVERGRVGAAILNIKARWTKTACNIL